VTVSNNNTTNKNYKHKMGKGRGMSSNAMIVQKAKVYGRDAKYPS